MKRLVLAAGMLAVLCAGLPGLSAQSPPAGRNNGCPCGPACRCGPVCDCRPVTPTALLPWRNAMEQQQAAQRASFQQAEIQRIRDDLQVLRMGQQQRPEPATPGSQVQHIYIVLPSMPPGSGEHGATPTPQPPVIVSPKIELPIVGVPRQQLPVEGQPRQQLPVEGQPRQMLPVEGPPRQQLPVEGQPRQDLGTQPAQPVQPAAVGPPAGYQRYTQSSGFRNALYRPR